MSRQLVNSTDLAARVAQLEMRCNGLFAMVQALQAARDADILKGNAKRADPFYGYSFGSAGHYDLNALQEEPQR